MLFFAFENNKKQTPSSPFYLPWLAMGWTGSKKWTQKMS
jgi:hypothetical protein